MGWSGRAPAPPVIEAGARGSEVKEHAPHVTSQFRNRRDRHRYRQELVSPRRARSARCDRAAAEVVAWSDGSAAGQSAGVPDRDGGLRRRASSQPQVKDAWPRRAADASEIRAALLKGTKERLPRRRG